MRRSDDAATLVVSDHPAASTAVAAGATAVAAPAVQGAGQTVALPAMQQLRWRINRLRLMKPAEIAWRAHRAIQVRIAIWGAMRRTPGVLPALQAWPAGAAGCAEPPRFGPHWLQAPSDGIDADATLAAARRILQGRFDVFALRDVALGFPPHWNRDPKTGVVAPLALGMAIDYRNPALVGDIKYLWEPNRHYELVTLAQAFRLSGDRRFADGCRILLDSWFVQMPYPLGQGWASALENAIRLINWALAWQLLMEPDGTDRAEGAEGAEAAFFDGTQGAAFRRRWLDCIARHCDFIACHLSLHSSANNHLLGEFAGLFIASRLWPCWPASLHWQQLSRDGIEAQTLAQVGPDGVDREQAAWYHHEVADLLLLCSLAARAEDRALAPACLARIEGMCVFIASLCDAGGHMPAIGDADDAMWRLSCEPGFDPYRSLLASGAVLFGRADMACKAGDFDDKSRWLLGVAGAERFARLRDEGHVLRSSGALPPPRQVFADAGYYVLGSELDTPSEVRIVADAGALGYLSIAAHGHADALAFTLSAGGLPLLIDPGTCAYHTQPAWRRYFRSTPAHNTACIDGRDQSEMGGAFLWLHKAAATCEAWHATPQEDFFAGTHDGYLRLPDPVLHRRAIRYRKAERLLDIDDLFICRGMHDIALHWHFSHACAVAIDTVAGRLTACRGHVVLQAQMPSAPGRLTLVQGQTMPPLGWVSPSFDTRLPAPTARWQQRIAGTTRCLTRFRIGL